ncbi:MAG: CAP domain-containing protein [Acidobacteriota bacterium]
MSRSPRPASTWFPLLLVGILASASPGLGEDPQTLLSADVNRSRGEQGLSPLVSHPAVEVAAQSLADEVTRTGRIDVLDVDGASRRLDGEGYSPHLVVLGYAQGEGDFPWFLDQWRQGDPATFERLQDPDLRHLALGIGDARGVPVYVLVAAASAGQRGRELAEALGDLEAVRADMLDAVNRERAEAGLGPLRSHPLLDRAAQDYAEDMLARGFYGHVSPEGEDVLVRVEATGYKPRRVGENLASGQPTIETVMDGWMASPDHRKNLLADSFRELGVGLARGPDGRGGWGFLWVQVFGTRR